MRVDNTDPERIVARAIELHAKGDPDALARAILNELWEAGYDVRPMPIRHNPTIPAESAYTAQEEATAAADFAQRGPVASIDVLRQQADESRNEPIRDKINEIARKCDEPR
jgi:hypothetical protein